MILSRRGGTPIRLGRLHEAAEIRGVSPQCRICVNVSVLRRNRSLLNKIFYSAILDATTTTLNALGDHHRVNTFYTSLDKVLAEIEIRLNGNDQDVLCALGDITLNDSPTSDSFDLVARYYNLDRELLLAGQRLRFSQFKTAHVEISIKTAAEVALSWHSSHCQQYWQDYKYFRTTLWKKNFFF